jgi:hypothetical protein
MKKSPSDHNAKVKAGLKLAEKMPSQRVWKGEGEDEIQEENKKSK